MANPMPLVPPVTRAVIPLRDHLWFIVKSAAAISVSVNEDKQKQWKMLALRTYESRDYK